MIRFQLREIMSQLGWTQDELARRAGLSRQTISHLIHSPQAIRLETLERIIVATGLPIESIIIVCADED